MIKSEAREGVIHRLWETPVWKHAVTRGVVHRGVGVAVDNFSR
jgi:hypothetical protein